MFTSDFSGFWIIQRQTNQWRIGLYWMFIALSLLLGIFSIFWTPWLPESQTYYIYASKSTLVKFFVSVFLFTCPIILYAYLKTRFHDVDSRVVKKFLPVTLLPAVAAVSLNFELLYIPFSSNFRIFFSLFIFAIVASNFISEFRSNKKLSAYSSLPILSILFIIYFGTCYYAELIVGTTSGDEVVYIVMADSIFNDRTVDMKNAWARLMHDGDVELIRQKGHMHIEPSARDGRWYSWHPFGLPLLISPLWAISSDAGNIIGRSIAMALFSTLGCIGLWLLCKRVGASNIATLITLLIFCGSVYWTSFASRVMTELPSAVLLIWLCWSIASVKDRPLASLIVATITASYCPYMHMRVLPLGMIGAFFYFLNMYLVSAQRKFITSKSIFFLFSVMFSYALWGVIQWNMFGRPLGPVSDHLMSYSSGAWKIFFDRYAASAGLISLFSIISAQAYWLRKSVDDRLLQYTILSMIFTCIFLTCTNIWSFVPYWTSTPGRYFFVVAPLLAPGVAYTLTSVKKSALTFYTFLALISIATTLLYFYYLPLAPKRTLYNHLLFLREVHETYGFFMPFAAYYDYSKTIARLSTIIFGLSTIIASYLILYFSSTRWNLISTFALILIFVTGFFAHISQADNISIRNIEQEESRIEIQGISMHKLTGENVADVSRGGNEIRIAKEVTHEPNLLAFGRYITLDKGFYIAEFDISIHQGNSPEPALMLEIAADRGKSVIVSKTIGHLNEWTIEKLEFEIDETTEVEPRVHFFGVGEVKFEVVRILPIN